MATVKRSRRVAKGKSEKEQSALEYLMTYGWAIMLIAVIVVTLYQLGFLNGSLAPKAQPGSCQVVRTQAGTSLEGECKGWLPVAVASFGGPNSGGHGGGGGPGCMNSTVPQINLNNGGYNTVNFWMYWNGTLNESPAGFPGYFLWLSNSNCIGYSTGNKDNYGVSSNVLVDKWVMVTLEFFNGPYALNSTMYINGTYQNLFQCQPNAHTGLAKSNLLFGSSTGSKYLFTGSMSNIQVYNTSLSSAEVSALYKEGIGGAPIRLQNLAAWYPLNTNTKDYSGLNGSVSINSCNSTYSGSYGSP